MNNLNLNKQDNSSPQTKNAFTIIEVVLVLAIAGLIFLMVFIALPALQRSQRDAQRKQDVDRVLAAVQSYRANNRGNVPRFLMGNEFKQSYLTFEGQPFMDPDGSDYNFERLDFGQEPPSRKRESNGATYIWVAWGGRCNGSSAADANGSNHHAIMMILEGGGVYCVDA